MSYTLGQAAAACRMSKATISKAVKSGKISAKKNADGSFSIEAVELHRVYPITVETVEGERSETPKSTQVNTEISNEMLMLEMKLEAAHQRINDLETDKEAWRLQATRLLAFSHDSKRGIISRLFGK
tara:strand:- start:140 stop:520 length:381 start_codon:yes stop_codon:yes gene_type:complete